MIAFVNKEHTKERKSEARFYWVSSYVTLRITSLHTPLALASAVFDFQRNQIGLYDPKWNKNIICTMMKYGETFYGRHTTPNTSCSDVK